MQEEGVHVYILLYAGAYLRIGNYTLGVDLGSENVQLVLKHKNIEASLC